MNTNRNKPVIGITLDYVQDDKSYSHYPWYALRADYANAIEACGGIALLLPYQIDAISKYVNMCDGLVISGGDFDIAPSAYGQDEVHESVILNQSRTKFERELLTQYLSARKPLLGICGGEQLLNVVLGGTLIQHIPDEVEGALRHEQPYPKNEPTHMIKCDHNSLLYKLVWRDEYMVNTTHHQAVKTLGHGVKATAKAQDGVIEAIEVTDHPFCIGVQWHPEFCYIEEDRKLIKGFVRACQKN